MLSGPPDQQPRPNTCGTHKMARASASGSLRSRKGGRGAADFCDDDDELLIGGGDASCGGRRQRQVLGFLCCLQAILLVGFAQVARQKRTERAGEPQSFVVRSLTDETLPFFVAGLPNGTLVNFHSLDCQFCKALEPEFEESARELHGRVPLATVSNVVAPRAMARYGVHRFPTLLWFRKGEKVLELPPSVRTAAKITEYVEWAMQPAVVSFDSRSDLDEAVPHLRQALKTVGPPVVVGFGTDRAVFEALESAAERARGKTVFIYVAEARSEDPVLRAYRKDEESDEEFRGSVNPESVRAWVETLLVTKLQNATM